jgi:hypothetical protein
LAAKRAFGVAPFQAATWTFTSIGFTRTQQQAGGRPTHAPLGMLLERFRAGRIELGQTPGAHVVTMR